MNVNGLIKQTHRGVGIYMKGSIDMTYRQPNTMRLPHPSNCLAKRKSRYYPWVIGGVLLGHVAVFAGMTQLQSTLVLPEVAKPIEIRMVELEPPPPPPPPKPIPAPKVVPPPAPPKPKIVPVTPPPVAKAPPKPLVTVAPVAKPIPKPIVREIEPQVEPTRRAVPITPPVPPMPTPVQPVPVIAPPPVVQAVAVPEPVVAPPAPPAEVVNSTPRTVSIAGVSYQRPPQVRYPEQARRRGDTGTVLVRALIGGNGRVESASVEQSSGNRLLDQAGLRAVKRALFNPYRENGITQSVYTLIPIAFNLNED